MAKNILVPVDGSKYMERNVRYACDMAKSMAARLTLLHVVTVPSPAQLEPYIVEPQPFDTTPFEQAGSKILEKARQIVKETGMDSETRMETIAGNPAQTIIHVAEMGKFDLIVLGAKGHSLLRTLMVGSVCDAIIHNAPCAVLVVR